MDIDYSPLFIGGVGGSGTRIVCNMAIDAGYFMGGNLNESLDSLDLRPFYDDWIREYLEQKESLEEFQTKLQKNFLNVIDKHNAQKNSDKWGAKNPRSILILPFLHSIYSRMKFIHVIRDGRDMAFSSNQNQTKLYGDIFCKDLSPNDPLYNLMYWSAVNQLASDYGLSNLRENYFLVRYEDILEKPKKTIDKICEFLESSITDHSKTVSDINCSSTIGRWKSHQGELSEISQFEKEALEKFGYV